MSSITKKVGIFFSLITTVLTLITFSIAFFTPPLSGPYCTGGCFSYPYTDIATRFPRDYYWMFPAILLAISYFVLMACIHFAAAESHKIFGHIGSSFALISMLILVTDYFLQLTVIQPSLLSGETDSIGLLSQFNAHGIFIALEEIGFLFMSLSMVSMVPLFFGKSRIEKGIQVVFVLCFILTILSLVAYSIQYGVNREYRFEIAAISINWLSLLIAGPLLTVFFSREETK